MSYSIVVGDLLPTLDLALKVNGAPKSLVGATAIQLRWLKPDDSEVYVDLTPVSLIDGLVKREWESGDTDVAGRHRGRVVVTWPGGENQTFPSTGAWFNWSVVA